MTVLDHEPVRPSSPSSDWTWERPLPIVAPSPPPQPVVRTRVLPARTLCSAALITLVFVVLIAVLL